MSASLEEPWMTANWLLAQFLITKPQRQQEGQPGWKTPRSGSSSSAYLRQRQTWRTTSSSVTTRRWTGLLFSNQAHIVHAPWYYDLLCASATPLVKLRHAVISACTGHRDLCIHLCSVVKATVIYSLYVMHRSGQQIQFKLLVRSQHRVGN